MLEFWIWMGAIGFTGMVCFALGLSAGGEDGWWGGGWDDDEPEPPPPPPPDGGIEDILDEEYRQLIEWEELGVRL